MLRYVTRDRSTPISPNPGTRIGPGTAGKGRGGDSMLPTQGSKAPARESGSGQPETFLQSSGAFRDQAVDAARHSVLGPFPYYDFDKALPPEPEVSPVSTKSSTTRADASTFESEEEEDTWSITGSCSGGGLLRQALNGQRNQVEVKNKGGLWSWAVGGLCKVISLFFSSFYWLMRFVR